MGEDSIRHPNLMKYQKKSKPPQRRLTPQGPKSQLKKGDPRHQKPLRTRASLHRSLPQEPRNLLARHLKLPPRTASPPASQMAQQQEQSPQARQPPPRRPPHPPKQERLEEKLQAKRMLLAKMRSAPSPNRRLAWMSI